MDLVVFRDESFRASRITRIERRGSWTNVYLGEENGKYIAVDQPYEEVAAAVAAALRTVKEEELTNAVLRLERYIVALSDKVNVLAEMCDELHDLKRARKN